MVMLFFFCKLLMAYLLPFKIRFYIFRLRNINVLTSGELKLSEIQSNFNGHKLV